MAELSPEAKAVVPEIAAFLRTTAELQRSKQTAVYLHVAANILEKEAGIDSFPTVGDG